MTVQRGAGRSIGDYQREPLEAWEEQRKIADERAGDRGVDELLLLEHHSVYTAGRRTQPQDRPTDGTPVIEVDRGGKITWHGPGQLVGYPIVRLAEPIDMPGYVRRLEEAAWPIFRKGHVPMIGEWVALPVLSSAGAGGIDDPLAEEVLYPTAHRLLQHCDAVLRLPGDSRGADLDVAIAHERGIPVYTSIDEIPDAAGAAA